MSSLAENLTAILARDVAANQARAVARVAKRGVA